MADAFNAYLPVDISIFGVVPVTKNLSMPEGPATPEHTIPAACIGISHESSSEDIQQRIQALKHILKPLEGRHAFHNYTIRRLYRRSQIRGTHFPSRSRNDERENEDSPDEENYEQEILAATADTKEKRDAGRRAYWLDESESGHDAVKTHFRTVTECTCEGPETIFGSSVVRISVSGESFMVHQIRKMVGTAIAVFRHVLPKDTIRISTCRHARVVLPLAPPHGLVLSGNSFFPFRGGYTRAKGGNGGYFFSKLGIELSDQIAERMNSFWSEKLAPVVAASADELKSPWKDWIESLELNRIDEVDFAALRELRPPRQ